MDWNEEWKKEWSIERAKSMEESFIDHWSDALKLSVTLQLAQLNKIQRVNANDLEWVRVEVVSLECIMHRWI